MRINELFEVSQDLAQRYKTAAFKDVDKAIAAKAAGQMGRDEYERKMTKRGLGTAAAQRRLTPHGTKLDLSPYGDEIQRDYERYRTDEQGVAEGKEDLASLRAKAKEISDKIDAIVKDGGRVGLDDPLSRRLKAIRAKIQQAKKQGVAEGGMMKSIQRGLKGWQGSSHLADIQDYIRNASDKTLLFLYKNPGESPYKQTPRDIQIKLINRELKRRYGVKPGEQGVAEGRTK